MTAAQQRRNSPRMAATSRNNAQPASGPILVTTGRTTVRIYPRAAERGRGAGFYVASYATGKRRLIWFTDLKEAKAEAARIAALTNAGDALGAQMTGKDRSQYLRATELVAPFALDPQTACALFAKAAELVGADNVVAAAKAFAKRSPASQDHLPLSKAVDDYIVSKASKGRSDRHLDDPSSRSAKAHAIKAYPNERVALPAEAHQEPGLDNPNARWQGVAPRLRGEPGDQGIQLREVDAHPA